ncbi:MAG: hypothetical protein KGR26_00240 [Cyanobacteria bacterium REEB65]|nr:hypothetical protein [Cyanobacteria bacterium REEB65]
MTDGNQVLERQIREWFEAGAPAPPPHPVKALTLREYAQKYQLQTFVETGTYLGQTVSALAGAFKEIHSIELSQDLFLRAKNLFSALPHITIHQGDSAAVLPEILKIIHEPTLFWLDGHWSAGITARGEFDTPIVQELETVLAHPISDHVIVIDDIREFTGESDYPSVVEVERQVRDKWPDCQIEVKYDMMRIVPASLLRRFV